MTELTETSMISYLNTPAEPKVGDITLFDHLQVPKGWMRITGQSLSISDYPELYGRYGKKYGSLGQDVFNLPTLLSPDQEFIGYYIFIGDIK